MVRNYRSRNQFDKGSKLTNEQTFSLFQWFFLPIDDGLTARHIGITPRTVKTKYRAINERILADRDCREALFDCLSPEIDDVRWISQNVDVTAPDFWEGLHTCLFNCPAVVEVDLPMTQVHKVADVWHIKGMSTSKGRITRLRMECAVCPVQHIHDNVKSPALQTITSFLLEDRQTTPVQLRDNFFRVLFEVGVRTRAGAAQAKIANAEEGRIAYLNALGMCGRELGVILARYIARTPLGN